MITNSPTAHCELRDCSKFAYCCVIHPELGAAVLTLHAAMMWAKISCSTHSCFWALPSCAYWTGISVIPENWLSSAGTGVEPTDMRQLRATAARPRSSCCWLLCQTDVMLASSQRRWWNPNQSPRTCQTEAWRLRGSASRLRRLSFPSSTCKCFMSRLVGVCEYSYTLMNPILLFCSLHLYPAFSSWDACRHAPRASPVSSLCLCRQRPDWD